MLATARRLVARPRDRGRARRPRIRLRGAADDYDPLLELIGDARFVLIGEASHGTHEFYRERGADHQAADPREGLQRRRRRGRLARRLSRQSLRPRSWRRRRGHRRAGGIPTIPDLDVAQRRRPRLRRLAPRPQRLGPAGHAQGRVLRPGPLQPARLDGGRDRLPGQGRPRGGRARARPLRLLRPLRRRPPGLWLCHRARTGPAPARTR